MLQAFAAPRCAAVSRQPPFTHQESIMSARVLAPAALACALAMPCASATAQSFRYAPGVNQYRMTVEARITQTVMGQNNETSMSSGQKFTMALTRRAPDTLAMAVTIDSIAQNMGQMGPVPGMDKLVGQKVEALLSPAGDFYAPVARPADSVAALASVADQLEHLLPRIRVALAAGASWTDTVSGTTSQGGLELKRQVISTYTVAGDTTVNGATAWKIDRASTSTTSGSGMIQGQNASMDGTSKGTGVVLIGHAGTFLGGSGQENVVAKLTLTDAGVAYDITTTATTRIEKVN
jgi:hypothetical protein